jgi:hypothetical protein
MQLKEQLISSVRVLRHYIEDEKKMEQVLKGRDIRPDDYDKVCKFIILLFLYNPSIRYAAPLDDALKYLFLHCMRQSILLDEMRQTFGQRK